ncbi:MAG: GNAT family N-acetyltransferase, partial [Aliifodinibius sp.]|nr:GNAT family N-acetyltransferase [candidate division Zixibacteria bacterium]NIT55664.1 GNAT family N-acetyltransferase [Fodinibius sp.]NIV10633.1 GNAT family N-acetyltransferase [Fodinibius sp.]NIY24248.1 GNAT family N-acetyltransferase [Fodinibius sp.]
GHALVNAVEAIALQHNIHSLHLEASITALPFFLAQDFHQVERVEKSYRGQLFTQFLLEKLLE